MKLSVVIADTDAARDAFVVWRGFENSVEKAKNAGYDGVELALKTAGEVDTANLDRALNDNGIAVSAVSTGQVFATLGLWMTEREPSKRRRCIDVFKDIIDFAGGYGGLVNIGRARGFIAPGQPKDEAEALFIDSVSELAEYAVKRNVGIIVEPVNRNEINFINSCDEARDIIERINMSNVGMMPDVFHMDIEDGDIAESFMRNKKYVRYVHLSDSERRIPGMGHIDFEKVFSGLSAIDYNGWVSVEILPEPDDDTAAFAAAAYLRPLVDAYNRELPLK